MKRTEQEQPVDRFRNLDPTRSNVLHTSCGTFFSCLLLAFFLASGCGTSGGGGGAMTGGGGGTMTGGGDGTMTGGGDGTMTGGGDGTMTGGGDGTMTGGGDGTMTGGGDGTMTGGGDGTMTGGGDGTMTGGGDGTMTGGGDGTMTGGGDGTMTGGGDGTMIGDSDFQTYTEILLDIRPFPEVLADLGDTFGLTSLSSIPDNLFLTTPDLTGTATFDGEAIGASRVGTSLSVFTASATLTADFGDDASFGTMSGKIDNFRNIDGSPVAANPVIDLNAAGIDFGLLTGEGGVTTMTFDGATVEDAGLWSAFFYSDDPDPLPDETPSYVGGDFQAETPNQDVSISGEFAAPKQ